MRSGKELHRCEQGTVLLFINCLKVVQKYYIIIAYGLNCYGAAMVKLCLAPTVPPLTV